MNQLPSLRPLFDGQSPGKWLFLGGINARGRIGLPVIILLVIISVIALVASRSVVAATTITLHP